MFHPSLSGTYRLLLSTYGPQGWWPLYTLRGTAGRDNRGYSKKPKGNNAVFPAEKPSPLSRFEIAAGAVLTQNTTWTNVEKSIDNLIRAGLMDPEKIREVPMEVLAQTIRSSGYYKQKSRKLKILASFLLDGGYLNGDKVPERGDLLGLWGIGKETADSILLYAYQVPFFVVDAYTKRIFIKLGVLTGTEDYDEIVEFFSSSLDRDVSVYKECHALIVMHAKEHCRKQPVCGGCVLKELCSFYRSG